MQNATFGVIPKGKKAGNEAGGFRVTKCRRSFSPTADAASVLKFAEQDQNQDNNENEAETATAVMTGTVENGRRSLNNKLIKTAHRAAVDSNITSLGRARPPISCRRSHTVDVCVSGNHISFASRKYFRTTYGRGVLKRRDGKVSIHDRFPLFQFCALIPQHPKARHEFRLRHEAPEPPNDIANVRRF